MATDCLYTRTYAEHAEKAYYAEHSAFSPNFAALVGEHLIDLTPTCPLGDQLVWVEGTLKGSPTRILVWSLHSKAGDTVLYASSFDNMEGLRILLGSWTIANGALSPTGAAGEHRVSLGSGNWTDFQIDVTATLLSGPGYGVYYRSNGQANISGYVFQFDPGLGNRFVVREVVGGTEQTQFRSAAMPAGFNLNAQHQISIEVVGSQQYMIVDGQIVLPSLAFITAFLQLLSIGWAGVLIGLGLVVAGLAFYSQRHQKHFARELQHELRVRVRNLDTPLLRALRSLHGQ